MAIHAPYNFVPLSAWIFKPDWGHQVSHDVPFSDGISGSLTLQITAQSPLLVGGRHDNSTDDVPGKVYFFETPDKRPAIPGSSLKGMIRNVLEIAAFGKMRMVDDRTLSVRDLTDGAKDIYGDNLTETVEENVYKPWAKAGWLRIARDEEGRVTWRLTPCKYVRVEQDDLVDYGRKTLRIDAAQDLKLKGTAVAKYEIWGQDKLTLRFEKDYQTKWPHHYRQIQLFYDKATRALGTGQEGTLVFTGQPSTNGGQAGRKHMEFIFYPPVENGASPNGDSSQVLDDDVTRGFLQVHADSESHETKEVWQFWAGKLHAGQAIPVFYLEKPGRIESLGLAMMYRLPYAHSIHDAVAHTNPGHVDDTKDDYAQFDPGKPLSKDNRLYDLPELLFGTVHKVKPEFSLKSRVSFSTAYLQGSAEIDEGISSKELVLSSPKPTYYPIYTRQRESDVADGRLKRDAHYRSFMDPNAEVSGWKRYPARSSKEQFEAPDTGGNLHVPKMRAKVKLFPLERSTCFTAQVRVHNLRPIELGALVWALTWGDETDLCHSLGMGKPLGLGLVKVDISNSDLKFVDPKKEAQSPKLDQCRVAFVDCMNPAWGTASGIDTASSGTWETSEQLTQLLAMANPRMAPGRNEKLSYMNLDDFQAHKGKKKGHPHHVLPSYIDYIGRRDEELFPRRSVAQRRSDSEAADLQQILDSLETEEEKAVYKELREDLVREKDKAKAENRANNRWFKSELSKRHGHLQLLIANELKAFYERSGKWHGTTGKQKKRVDFIRKILGED